MAVPLLPLLFSGWLNCVMTACLQAEPASPESTEAGFRVAVEFRAERTEPPTEEIVVLGQAAAGKAGWVMSMSPSGAWCFRISDGTNTLSYLPTAPRQSVFDGQPHLVQVSGDRARSELRFFFDGRQVAIYEAGGFEAAFDTEPHDSGRSFARQSHFAAAAWSEEDRSAFAAEHGFHPPPAPELEPGESLRVLTWNIWHGGREDGNEIGPQRVADIMRASRADVLCVQETYGSGALLANALGYELYLRSSNLSILSRFPLERTFRLYEPFRFGGARVRLGAGRAVDVFSLWIHYLPDYWEWMKQEEPPDAAAMVAAEMETRGAEIEAILAALSRRSGGLHPPAAPLIIGGDFNSGSHLDWTKAAANAHRGLVVEFPVSKAMAGAGFIDSFRTAHPDPLDAPGLTWSPRFADAWQDRIDYLYFRGPLELVGAEHLDDTPDRWPSDHGAMLAEFRLPPAN